MTNWLLLHGTPLTPAIWDGVVPALQEHGAVAAPHVTPGAGPADGVQRELARHLVGADVGARPPWHLVGHSFGGQVALEIACVRPDLVASLTLLCTRDTPYPEFTAAAADVGRGVVDVDGSLQRWFSPADLATDDSVVRYARQTLASADHLAWARALSAIAVFQVSADVSTISCPVRAVAAAHDRVSDPQTMAAMVGRMPRGELTVLDGAWHMSVFTDPDRLAGLLLASASSA